MTITILGTGTSQGVPVIGCDCDVCRSLDFRDKRLRVSVHVESEGRSLVIDTGPDFRTQALRERIRHLDAVLFTHAHKDHTAGLDDVRPFNFRQNTDIPLYGQAAVLEQIRVEFAYAFAEHKYPGIPRLELNPIGNEVFSILGLDILPVEVMHHRLPVFGYRIGDFVYITDANFIPPAELEKIRGCKILVLNALQRGPKHISHFTLPEALEVIDQIRPEAAYLTHISHKMGLHQEVEASLPPGVYLAYDGLRFSL
ncbi:MBL fold metallo-hydrolase [Siphonobacter aquaeclarae]|uniref:Phosphoribosyl 1,2-cyclic phosphate phosphodiesterase n=1 Tax=Siphonobacter aquaeclarae TaxID=563176 RepID=A0A1G9L7M2_9BACT|nr:MBL fold metallo-hydrolase [Siphonobacter aquaeclarae]SDL57970.1 phosphoribosyl 1,2-cyclic phosphate phosphodiesterase [Siphonobacter aquaeclarae]